MKEGEIIVKSKAEEYMGKTKLMKCGLKATIIAYRNSKDIDVQFENGAIREHMAIDNFNMGRISPIPAPPPEDKYIGQTRTMNCGMKATIVKYRNHKDIDVQFENGKIRKHRCTSDFNKGEISPTPPRKGTDLIGKTKTMRCGLKATIIAHRKMNDIDVRFEDGTIRKHMHMSSFNNCDISIKPRLTNDAHIGQTKRMKCGIKATVTAYRTFQDIDIQFEDGTVIQNVSFERFKKGVIGKTPKLTETDYINSTNTMNNGLKVTIITYRGSNDIDVQFEDGVIREHTSVGDFNRGLIAHPTKILFNTYKITKIAFVFHNKTYFYVTYTKNNCEIMDVMCIDDMKQNYKKNKSQ